MKNIIFFLMLISVFNLFAATEIPTGSLTTRTWSLTGSPYNINGDVTIPAGQTLTINAGVQVIAKGKYSITVNGALVANGNAANNVVFTAANTATGWMGLNFVDISAYETQSKLEYCEIQYVKKSGGTLPPVTGMVAVAGGTFNMGAVGIAEPVHSVTLSSFYIGKYEVTQTEWVATMGTNPSYFTGDLNRPVEQVSWYDIMVYCNKRSIAENLTPCYSINGSTNPANWGTVPSNTNATWDAAICDWSVKGYRLPTEAEWEYAARGGKISQGYIYSGSNNLNAVAWNCVNSGNTTHTIATKAANELGISDMSGNVWEWNWDWFGSYSSNVQTNPHGAESGSYRVLRGGSYSIGDDSFCRVANRDYGGQCHRSDSLGFRLARSF